MLFRSSVLVLPVRAFALSGNPLRSTKSRSGVPHESLMAPFKTLGERVLPGRGYTWDAVKSLEQPINRRGLLTSIQHLRVKPLVASGRGSPRAPTQILSWLLLMFRISQSLTLLFGTFTMMMGFLKSSNVDILVSLLVIFITLLPTPTGVPSSSCPWV